MYTVILNTYGFLLNTLCSTVFYSFKEFVKIAKNLLLLFILILLVSSFIWCLLVFDLVQTVNDQSWFLCLSTETLQLLYFHLFSFFFSRRKSPFLVVPDVISSVSMIIFVALLWTFSSSTILFEVGRTRAAPSIQDEGKPWIYTVV